MWDRTPAGPVPLRTTSDYGTVDADAKPPATAYTCDLDGSDLQQVTPWEDEVVAMMGE